MQVAAASRLVQGNDVRLRIAGESGEGVITATDGSGNAASASCGGK